MDNIFGKSFESFKSAAGSVANEMGYVKFQEGHKNADYLMNIVENLGILPVAEDQAPAPKETSALKILTTDIELEQTEPEVKAEAYVQPEVSADELAAKRDRMSQARGAISSIYPPDTTTDENHDDYIDGIAA